LLRVGDLLVVQSEPGDVVLVEATPEAHREVARLSALSEQTWNSPAIAGDRLLVRNAVEAVCYQLPLRSGEVIDQAAPTDGGTNVGATPAAETPPEADPAPAASGAEKPAA
jgi:hypothetical protein